MPSLGGFDERKNANRNPLKWRQRMKLFTIALGLGILGVSSAAFATPYYVGENLTPSNNITLEFLDTPTKDDFGGSQGNIANFELKGDYKVWRDLTVGANLPFFFASTSAATAAGGTDSKASIGNIALSGNWAQDLSDGTADYSYGYAVNLDLFLPSSRSDESAAATVANPTIDWFRYAARTTTLNPTLGGFIEGSRFLAKLNVGLGYSFIQRDNSLPSDRNRFNTTIQAAATWKAMNWLAANLEFNSIIHDKASSGAINGENNRFRYALAPSVSGTWRETVRANVFANVPLDKPTREVHFAQFGAGVGYMF